MMSQTPFNMVYPRYGLRHGFRHDFRILKIFMLVKFQEGAYLILNIIYKIKKKTKLNKKTFFIHFNHITAGMIDLDRAY